MGLTGRGRRVAGVLLAIAVALAAFGWFATRGDGVIRPKDPCADPPPMRTIDGVTLQPIAMTAFRQAERYAGRDIPVVQSYRSCAKQALACQNICGNRGGCPGRCAVPGSSYHQLGAAVDVSGATLDTPGVVAALERAGWCQSVPANDPGHFSFGGCH